MFKLKEQAVHLEGYLPVIRHQTACFCQHNYSTQTETTEHLTPLHIAQQGNNLALKSVTTLTLSQMPCASPDEHRVSTDNMHAVLQISNTRHHVFVGRLTSVAALALISSCSCYINPSFKMHQSEQIGHLRSLCNARQQYLR